MFTYSMSPSFCILDKVSQILSFNLFPPVCTNSIIIERPSIGKQSLSSPHTVPLSLTLITYAANFQKSGSET